MHDAVVLANWIHALPNNASAKEINHAFQAYQSERMPWVQEAFKQSRAFQVANSKVNIQYRLILTECDGHGTGMDSGARVTMQQDGDEGKRIRVEKGRVDEGNEGMRDDSLDLCLMNRSE
jgi:hypothetical protein